MEETIRTLEQIVEMKRYIPVTSLQYLPYYATKDDEVTPNRNTLAGSKSDYQSSIVGPELKSVCYSTFISL